MKFRVSRDALLKRRSTWWPAWSSGGRHCRCCPMCSSTSTATASPLPARISRWNWWGVYARHGGEAVKITVPARKLADICKSLPEGAEVEFSVSDGKATVRSGRSRFTLATLPAREFPNIEDSIGTHQILLKQGQLRRLIDRTAFAMAQQDVRYYLNGMYWEFVRAPARRGYGRPSSGRVHVSRTSSDLDDAQVIIPRKGVLELSRLMQHDDEEVTIILGSNHMRATTENFTFTSKLVDGKFPDYERVLPRAPDKILQGSRLDLRQAFTRTAILSNEKYRGVRLKLSGHPGYRGQQPRAGAGGRAGAGKLQRATRWKSASTWATCSMCSACSAARKCASPCRTRTAVRCWKRPMAATPCMS
jgi:hypothetical protein